MYLLWLSRKYEFHWYSHQLKFYRSIGPSFAKVEYDLACSIQVKQNTIDFFPILWKSKWSPSYLKYIFKMVILYTLDF